jgi:hypothetical protein
MRRTTTHYESLHAMRDPKVRTVRIDLSYRAVIVHPPSGNLYMLVWVDNHDEAMAWAQNKVFDVNAMTGAIQVVDMEFAERAREEAVAAKPAPAGLFARLSDEDLARTGLPAVLAPAVRAVASEDDLDKLQPYLPQEAFEALFLIACGYEGSEDELLEMLDASLDKWRVFVRAIFRGPARVLGGAGTGKTAVAMHRVRYLPGSSSRASRSCSPRTTATWPATSPGCSTACAAPSARRSRSITSTAGPRPTRASSGASSRSSTRIRRDCAGARPWARARPPLTGPRRTTRPSGATWCSSTA